MHQGHGVATLKNQLLQQLIVREHRLNCKDLVLSSKAAASDAFISALFLTSTVAQPISKVGTPKHSGAWQGRRG